MIIVKPEIINDVILTSSNVAENDAPLWVSGQNTNLNDLRIYQHRVYKNITGTEDVNIPPPDQPLNWLDLGATNRYRMFDKIVGNPTTNMNTIDVTITPGIPITAIVLFNLDAASIRVIGESASTGVFYDKTVELQDYSGVTDWFQYFYSDVGERIKSEMAFLDIPVVGAATYRVVIDNGNQLAMCGEMVIGKQTVLGYINYGTSVGIIDYSKKELDQFGNFVVAERRFANRANYDVTVNTPRINFVKRTLAEVRATPVVYIGNSENPETIVYGFYRNFDIVISGPSASECSLEVEGLT